MTTPTAPDPRETLKEWDDEAFLYSKDALVYRIAAALRVTLAELECEKARCNTLRAVNSLVAEQRDALAAELESLRGDVERGLKPTLAATIAARDEAQARLAQALEVIQRYADSPHMWRMMENGNLAREFLDAHRRATEGK